MNKFKLTRDEKKAIPFILPGSYCYSIVDHLSVILHYFKMSFSENAIGQSGFAGLTNYSPPVLEILCVYISDSVILLSGYGNSYTIIFDWIHYLLFNYSRGSKN
ncbi:MAG: hypothetical protein ACLS61_10365 [Ruminococcus sp.]